MAISDEKQRVVLSVPRQMVAQVDEYCSQTGLSRSAFFCSAASDKLQQSRMTTQALDSLVQILASGASDKLPC